MEMSWSRLWDEGSDDDEDYDPLKDPLSKEKDDSDDDFDGLMELLSPSKKSGSGEREELSGEHEGRNGDSSQVKDSPEVIGKRTRRRVRLPDEVWQDAESQLEQAERVLDPTSPNEVYADPNTQALSSQEYQRLLAVARGQAEPEDADEDEDDEDFVPESDPEAEGAKGEEEGAAQVSISRGELSDLIAENREREQNSVVEPVPKRKGGRKKKSETETTVRVVSDGFAGGSEPGGFTKDQCTQLAGQLREYFQLASQQYVMSCCDKENIEERADDIKMMYEGLADLYRIWEVTTEYSKIQEKAMKILTDQIIGAPPSEAQAVQVRPEPRFSFFNVPGIELVPTVLQRVADACSDDSSGHATHHSASGDAEQANAASETGKAAAEGGDAQAAAAKAKALEKAQEVLSVLDPYFNPELKLSSANSNAGTGCEVGGSFTCAEDNLLLTGLRRFGTDWSKIHLHVLPTKTMAQLRTRYRKLVRRDAGINSIKDWKLAHAAGLSETENELLQKGVQYYGARFDLISEKIIVNRSEEELKRAYAKLMASSMPAAGKTEGRGSKMGRPRSSRGGDKAPVHSQFLEDGSSSSDGELPSSKRRKGRSGVRLSKAEQVRRSEEAMAVQALIASGTFEQEHLSDSDKEEGGAAEAAVGARGLPQPNAGEESQPSNAQSQLLPRGMSTVPGSHGASPGLIMTGSCVMSDSDSGLPSFETSNDGMETRQMFRMLDEGVSETSNDAWLMSQPHPQPQSSASAPASSSASAPASSSSAQKSDHGASAAAKPDNAATVEASSAGAEPDHSTVPTTPAVARSAQADRTLLDSASGKSSAPTPFQSDAAKDAAESQGGGDGEGAEWSQEQDLVILVEGRAAAEASASTPTAYEDAWQKLSTEGKLGLQGRCVKAMARRYEMLVSKAINFSRSTTSS